MSRSSTEKSELPHVLSGHLPQSLQQLISPGKIPKYSDLLAPTRTIRQFNSGMFARPPKVRETVQTLPSSSSMDWSVPRARTHAREYGRKHGEGIRTVSVESVGSTSPVSWPETPRRLEPHSRSGPPRSGITDPGKHMPRSNRPNEANQPKTTAQLTARCRTDRDMKLNADSQAARAGGRQVCLSAFEFVPASRLRSSDPGGNDSATEETEGGKR